MLALGWGVFSFSLLQVVGSQARILYSDQKGRVAIAVAINQAIASGKIKVSETACGASRRLHRHLFTEALLGGASQVGPQAHTQVCPPHLFNLLRKLLPPAP